VFTVIYQRLVSSVYPPLFLAICTTAHEYAISYTYLAVS